METSKGLNVLDKARLPEVAKSSPTALAILTDCSKRARMRWETDLDRHAVKLAHKGFKVVSEDYLNAWKELESLGAGVIIHGRNGNSNRFRWHYSLKDVGTAAIHPDAIGDIQPLVDSPKPVTKRKKTRMGRKRRVGRPKGSKNRPKLVAGGSTSYKPEVVFTVKGLDGRSYPIAFEEAIRISNQVNQIRQLAVKASA